MAFLPLEKVSVKVYVPFFALAASFTLTVNLEAVAAVTVAVVPAWPEILGFPVKLLPVMTTIVVLPGMMEPVVFDALGIKTTATAKAIGVVPASVPVAVATLITQSFALAAVVPHDPVPMVPVATLNVVEGNVPSVPTTIGAAVAVSQPAADVALARHSIAYTESPAVKLLPVMTTTPPAFSPVAGVAVTVGTSANEMSEYVIRAPVREPMTTAQLRSVADVPHVPLPMVPVLTAKFVEGSVPSAFTVAVTGAAGMSQPAAVVAPATHSTTATIDPAEKPEPVTTTVWPLTNAVLGVTVIAAPAAPAVTTPNVAILASASVATAILLAKCFMLNDLPYSSCTDFCP